MALVTQRFMDIWRSKAQVGSRRPTMVVEVRGGSWRRAYRDWPNAIDATIPGETRNLPWYPIFTETTPWVQVPNVLSCEFTQDFEQNGMSIATIVVDNVAFEQATGPFGDLYHAISRGYLSPSRGYDAPGRPDDGLAQNGWYDVLTEQRQVRVWQGFGEPERVNGAMPESGGTNGAWVFNGLIDDVDGDSVPARLTIIARMGKVLTDSRVFGWNKSKQLLDPITFSDRLEADNIQDVGENAAASSEHSAQYVAANVLDDDGTNKTYWRSANAISGDYTEWVEIRLPSGRYRQIVLECDAGMRAYIGFFVRAWADGTQAMVDGSNVDDGFVVIGDNIVPGANGGWPYIHEVASTSGSRTLIDFGHSIVTGNDSVVRVGFRNLAAGDGTFRARVRSFKARRRERSEAAIKEKWILVDDLSDVVRVVLRWAGYQDWDVENTGSRLKGKAIFNRATFLIDIIKRAQELTGYVFFVSDPINGESQGVPVFRRNSALQSASLLLTEIRDTDLLTGLRTKRSEEPLPYIIRVRGKTKRARTLLTSQGGGLSLGVTTLGGDTSVRIMAVYRPPWTQDNTLGGVIKHHTHTDNALRSLLECEIGCYLVAIASCLAAFTAVIEIPANPAIELDQQIGLIDTATGLNTRLWISARSSTFTAGERTAWTMSVQGALIDTADLIALKDEIATIDFSPEVSPITPTSRNTPGRFR